MQMTESSRALRVSSHFMRDDTIDSLRKRGGGETEVRCCRPQSHFGSTKTDNPNPEVGTRYCYDEKRGTSAG